MGTAAAGAIAVLAALLAIAAILLASIANRRWVLCTKRLRADPQTNEAAGRAAANAGRRLADQQGQLELQQSALHAQDAAIRALGDQVAELSTQLDAQAAQFAELSTQVAAQGAQLAALARSARALADAGRTSLRRVAIVRYDAFSDVGGRLSYSTAILDDTATGLVITCLAGKSDIRTYVKAVSGGIGQPPLTPEEEQAVSATSGATEASESGSNP